MEETMHYYHVFAKSVFPAIRRKNRQLAYERANQEMNRLREELVLAEAAYQGRHALLVFSGDEWIATIENGLISINFDGHFSHLVRREIKRRIGRRVARRGR